MEICLLFVDIVVAVNFSHIKLKKKPTKLGKMHLLFKRIEI